mgnify:CR=1 FL=1|jgi:prolipoprotein diacylglyceryltransferase
MFPLIHIGYGVYIPVYPIATGISIALVAYLVLKEDDRFAGELLFFITSFILSSRIFLGKDIFKLWESGYSLMMGVTISFFPTLIFLLIRRKDFLYFFDLCSRYAPIGLAVHRIFGCFLAGCCWGIPSSFGFFPHPWSLAFKHVGYTKLFPVQLFEGLWWIISFFIVRNSKDKTSVFLLCLFISRIFEYVRGDIDLFFSFGGIKISFYQISSAFLLILTVTVKYILKKINRKNEIKNKN